MTQRVLNSRVCTAPWRGVGSQVNGARDSQLKNLPRPECVICSRFQFFRFTMLARSPRAGGAHFLLSGGGVHTKSRGEKDSSINSTQGSSIFLSLRFSCDTSSNCSFTGYVEAAQRSTNVCFLKHNVGVVEDRDSGAKYPPSFVEILFISSLTPHHQLLQETLPHPYNEPTYETPNLL